jgi:predicted RNA-binding Zn-ribbon protein involved in translation (DUF1610 family)
MNHRPVCVKCEVELRPEKNSVGLVDYMTLGEGEDEKTDPSQVWEADLWKCPVCGYEIVTGFGNSPVSTLHESNFQRILTRYSTVSLLISNRDQKLAERLHREQKNTLYKVLYGGGIGSSRRITVDFNSLGRQSKQARLLAVDLAADLLVKASELELTVYTLFDAVVISGNKKECDKLISWMEERNK